MGRCCKCLSSPPMMDSHLVTMRDNMLARFRQKMGTGMQNMIMKKMEEEKGKDLSISGPPSTLPMTEMPPLTQYPTKIHPIK